MKRYQCHKQVHAAKIIGIASADCALIEAPKTTLYLDGGETKEVDEEWMTRNPQTNIGGYFVEYEDGYTSYSPARPFEAGYTVVG